jgi:radical SAM superfamily enzyme YgiQ (UPF0313 family)
MFPFFMGYAAALLENESFEVEAIDAVPLNLHLDDFYRRVAISNPDVIVMEPATTSFTWTMEVISQLKKDTSAIIVLAGPHASIMAGHTLKGYDFIDYVLIGEYEYSLLHLIRALNSEDNIDALNGIAYRTREHEIVVNENTLSTDPDSLPMPARHLFPASDLNGMHYYHDGFCQNRPAVQVHSSRGCPFSCNFCLWTQTMYKPGMYKTIAASRVVDEMVYVTEKFGAKEVYFDDDTFTGNKKHVLQICDEILARKLTIPWSVMGDAMITDSEMLVKMKAAGCIGIKFGLESGVPEILKNINKPLQLPKLLAVIDACKRLGMKTHVSVSFGHFGETEETVSQTMKFVTKLDSDSIQFSLATPYPGTRFYNEVIRRHLLTADEWDEFDPTHNPIVRLPGISQEFLKKVESKAHGHWLRRKILKPDWVKRQTGFLLYILKRQGISGLISRLKRAFGIIFLPRFT